MNGNKKGTTDTGDVNERRIEQIENIMDNYTRTERHLEQYSHIGSKENKDNARRIQEERREDIDHLKNLVAHGEHTDIAEEMKNVEKNYKYTEGYLEENREHMDGEALENTLKKQANRREQMDNLRG